MPGLPQVGAQKHECTCHHVCHQPPCFSTRCGCASCQACHAQHAAEDNMPAGLKTLSKQSPTVTDSDQPGMVLVRSVIQHHLPRSDNYCLTLHLPHDQGSGATNGGSPAHFQSDCCCSNRLAESRPCHAAGNKLCFLACVVCVPAQSGQPASMPGCQPSDLHGMHT